MGDKKTRFGVVLIGEAKVEVKVEEIDHPNEHVLRFTAKCGDSVKTGHVTLKVNSADTQESVEAEIRRLGRIFATEAEAHARTGKTKTVFMSKDSDLFKED